LDVVGANAMEATAKAERRRQERATRMMMVSTEKYEPSAKQKGCDENSGKALMRLKDLPFRGTWQLKSVNTMCHLFTHDSMFTPFFTGPIRVHVRLLPPTNPGHHPFQVTFMHETATTWSLETDRHTTFHCCFQGEWEKVPKAINHPRNKQRRQNAHVTIHSIARAAIDLLVLLEDTNGIPKHNNGVERVTNKRERLVRLPLYHSQRKL
jgi:hypothetical protein